MNNKFKQFILFIIFILLNKFSVSAGYPDYENIYVNDWANLLDVQAEAQITQKLKRLKTDTHIEITLVTIQNMSDYENTKSDIEEFALGLFNHWGVGDSSKNDGVLVLVSHSDRKMRIATGKAYNNTNKNTVAKSIIDKYFIPSFKRDNYQQGIVDGMDKLISTFIPNSSLAVGFMDNAKKSVDNPPSKAWYELKNSQFLVFSLIFVGIILFNGFKSLVRMIYTGKSKDQEFFIRQNYLVDKQPKKFKQVFPNEKKIDKKNYIIGLVAGLIALLFLVAFIGFTFFKVSFFAILSGMGVSYATAEFFVRKRNKPKQCPRCHSLMDRLSEVKDDMHLELPERVEESLKAIDYDVWLCGSCQQTKKLAYPYWFSTIKICQQCEYKTLEININTLRSATTSSEGLEEIIEDCKYCDYHRQYEQIIPREPDDDDYDSGGSDSSFGGGSSSGGGASGSW